MTDAARKGHCDPSKFDVRLTGNSLEICHLILKVTLLQQSKVNVH